MTVSVVTTLVAGLLALIGVGIGPAQANHGSLTVEVYREVSEVTEGGSVTLTARVQQSNGLPPSPLADGVGLEIDWEVEGGKIDGENGANTPGRPDFECETNEATPQTRGYPVCSWTIDTEAGMAGISFVRVWIDHDGLNENETEFGGTEADPQEGRLSDPVRDCATEAPMQPVPGDDPDPEAVVEDEEPLANCESDADGAATAGRNAEYDQTDVVKVTVVRPNRKATVLDCAELTGAPIGEDAIVRCFVLDEDGIGVGDVHVDAEHLGGANDPDGDGDEGSAPADYETGTQISDANGRFDLAIDDAGKGESGFATICAWIDTDWEDDDDLGIPPVEDPSWGPSSEDGLGCAAEPAPSTTSNNDDADDTDKFRVRWQTRALSRLDVTPETDRTAVNTTRTITAATFDQFGDPWTSSAAKVNFEFMAGSPSDIDGNDITPPDGSCTTKGDGSDGSHTCTFSYSRGATGKDTICSWLNGFEIDTSCRNETQAVDREDHIDVVTNDWFAPVTPTTTPQQDQGYVLVGGDGGIFTFGGAKFHGSTGNLKLNQPIIGIAYMPGGEGYWLVAKDGGVFTFGAAKFHGSMGDKTLNAPVLGMESTPSGNGYWLYAADGGIFTFGDAQFKGSTGDKKLNAPMIGMAVTEKGDGYWLVAQDGGVFTFNAPFFGSTGDKQLNQPVFDMAPAANDKGYWLVARDGGVFTFGDIDFYGSAANVPGRGTVIGMGDTPTGKGYWISDVNGKVMPFGDAKFFGDRSTSANNAPMVAFATVQPKG